ncbi:hypothetical protein [Brevundimonas lenta]|uniref:Uncharacterized protein n=1 Tax=Brevundimonas lenta TaxID=424796 RepID=A0A7W6JEB2_9CAUL|nr:hypothetical protein [Brevundimonas lenta]MBB4083526.1 hypothetical protein [Brevundimonas lenta]
MITALLSAFALLTAPATTPAAPQCRFEGEPRQWTAEALASWDRLDRERLRLERPVTPVITLFDQSCAYTLTPDRRGDFRVGARRYRTGGRPHDGRIGLPDGNTVPAQRLAFAAPISNGEMFFIMALPSLWRADASEPRDARLLSMVVFMHEFAHTQQGEGLGERIDDLLTRGLPEDANDDVVQDRFAAREGYTAAYVAERDLFYQAAQAGDAAQARDLLQAADRRMTARRDRWFTGEDRLYAEADDIFLTMEGSGNWAAWAWLTHPEGGRLSPDDATAFIRGGGTHWSQDEGLGIMLALERLTPDWPRLAFGPDGVTADELIARALR